MVHTGTMEDVDINSHGEARDIEMLVGRVSRRLNSSGVGKG